MIYGIGVDIVKIERIRKAVERQSQKFLARVFTENEIDFCYKRSDPYQAFAARFAAKEALLKSVGKGILNPLLDIDIRNLDTGKPYIHLSGKLERFFMENKLHPIHLSLSHEKEYAVALVVVEKN
ncbi:MAG TPA: holo-ACP synthase [Thermodesulfovibrionia bacterium]|nr:holo-ACP synthase [Thermodesulfovibrionia bacterium]